MHEILALQWRSSFAAMLNSDSTVYNFEIRRDVTSGRLRISGQVQRNARVVYGIAAKHACVMITRSEARSLPKVTSL